MSRLRLSLPVVAVAGLSLTLAACGGSSGGSGGASTPATNSSTQSGQANGGGTRSADFQKFQQCLKDNGVTLPNRGNGQGRPGGGNGYGPPPGAGASSATPPTTTNGAPPAGGGGRFGGQNADPKVQKAMQACAKYRPQFNGRGGNGAGRPQQSIKAFTPYLTCLKDKGLDVKVSDGFNALRGLKQDDPKVQAALKACQSKIPQRPRGQGGGGASSSTPSSTTGAA
jgi:hypothetical protein